MTEAASNVQDALKQCGPNQQRCIGFNSPALKSSQSKHVERGRSKPNTFISRLTKEATRARNDWRGQDRTSSKRGGDIHVDAVSRRVEEEQQQAA